MASMVDNAETTLPVPPRPETAAGPTASLASHYYMPNTHRGLLEAATASVTEVPAELSDALSAMAPAIAVVSPFATHATVNGNRGLKQASSVLEEVPEAEEAPADISEAEPLAAEAPAMGVSFLAHAHRTLKQASGEVEQKGSDSDPDPLALLTQDALSALLAPAPAMESSSVMTLRTLKQARARLCTFTSTESAWLEGQCTARLQGQCTARMLIIRPFLQAMLWHACVAVRQRTSMCLGPCAAPLVVLPPTMSLWCLNPMHCLLDNLPARAGQPCGRAGGHGRVCARARADRRGRARRADRPGARARARARRGRQRRRRRGQRGERGRRICAAPRRPAAQWRAAARAARDAAAGARLPNPLLYRCAAYSGLTRHSLIRSVGHVFCAAAWASAGQHGQGHALQPCMACAALPFPSACARRGRPHTPSQQPAHALGSSVLG